MKIIGPCAGIGSRLRPFTLSKPKTFIHVAGKTVLEHILNKFGDTFDSETELILIVGYKKRQITEFVKQKYHDKFKLTFIEQIPRGYNDDIPFYWGLGEAVYLASSRFEEFNCSSKEADKREGSLIFLADMIPIDEYSYLMYRYYESDVDGIITVMEVPKEDANSYGIVIADSNSLIQKLIEKPKDYVSNLAIAGIYAFSNSATKALFDIIKGYLDKRTEDSKEVYLTESLQDLIDSGFKIAAVNLKKGILDFGRPSEVLIGNRYLLEQQSVKKEVFSELNILSETSFIKNPVYIGENTSIIKSVIGPYVSIGANSIIENCILENCVVESDTTLKNVISENSIIGSNVRVENISKNHLIIGDKSIY
ncbi:MAG TPA: sugar phosphate nucleotidyltransferase [Candidatus Nanopelagicaceae bacterium]|nr:sugar phosphate nucleotidyltransferase [Candidatus Nanopelagicaceae bacterium]